MVLTCTLCLHYVQESDGEEDDSGNSGQEPQPTESHDQGSGSHDQREQPVRSLSSVESESSMGLPEDEASIDIPASTVQQPLRPTSFPRCVHACITVKPFLSPLCMH